MAEFSIDQKKLPGVKDVCRDFAVREDHCLAHNLQEQEIESHLASNIHKSRLAQHDLKVAKLLQEEEDKRAKAQSQRQFRDLERQDNEIAQGIQEELVRQAEQQRLQEEKDMAIARKMQEKEMKEERRRQKQLEANFEEEYFEDEGALVRPDKRNLHAHPRSHSRSPGRFHESHAPLGHSRGDQSPEYSSAEPKRSRDQARADPAAPHGRSKYPKHHLEPPAGAGRGTYADTYPEHSLPPRGKHGDRYPDHPGTETGRVRGQGAEENERVVRRKERPPRPLYGPREGRDRDGDRYPERDYRGERNQERDRQRERDPRRGKEQERVPERPRDRGASADRYKERDGQRDRRRDKEEDNRRARTRSRERVLEAEKEEAPEKERTSWGDEEEEEGRRRHGDGDGVDDDDDGSNERGRRAGGRRQRAPSDPDAVFEELGSNEGPRGRERPGRGRSHTHPPGEAGRIVHRGGGTIVAGGGGGGGHEYGLSNATQGLGHLDLRDQEVIDMEVARRLQEEEIKASKKDKHAAQVAQDEEIARLLMEQEKKEYKRIKEREREKEKEKERERMAMEKMALERKRHEAAHRSHAEDVVRPRARDEYGGPRSREEYEQQRQRNQNKPTRPPQPRTPNYENVNPGPPYGYSDNPFSPRGPPRQEAAYKGAYYRQ